MGPQGIGLRYVGRVDNEDGLNQITGQEQGDIYINDESGDAFIWNELVDPPEWQNAGPIVGQEGPAGEAGPTAVSADGGNISSLGSDGLVYTTIPLPKLTALGGVFATTPEDGRYVTAIGEDGKPVLANFADTQLGYLPLAGGTMTGVISFQNEGLALRFGTVAPTYWLKWAADRVEFGRQTDAFFTLQQTLVTSAVPIALPADPLQPLHAATKQYVDNKPLPIATQTVLGGIKVGTYTSGQSVNGVAADGTLLWGTASALGAPLRLPPVSINSFNGTDAYWYQDTGNNVRLVTASGVTGIFIALNGQQTFNRIPLCSIAPTANNHLTNKEYVDSRTTGFLPLAGGTMTGAITLPTTVQSLVWGTTTYNVFGGTGGVAVRHGTNNIVTYSSTAATYVQRIIASGSAGITFGASNGPGFIRASTNTKIAATGMIELPTTAPTAADAVRKDYVDGRVVVTAAGATAPSTTGLSEGSLWLEV
jgi:hypothetical protein